MLILFIHFEERAFALECIWMCISAARQILNTCTERFDSCCTLSSLHCSHFIIMTGDLYHPAGWTSRTVCTSEPSHGAAARHTPQGNWCLSFSYCIIGIQTPHNYQLSILSQYFTHNMILLFFTFCDMHSFAICCLYYFKLNLWISFYPIR